MGMFDDIIVPKAYLRGLIRKDYEKLLNKDHLFQTKDLDNVMDVYKVYRQRLYRLDRSEFILEEGTQHTKLTDKWNGVKDDVGVRFYTNVEDKAGNDHWFEFSFIFVKGKLDKKKLITCELRTTSEEEEAVDKMWGTEQEIFDNYRENSSSYRFFLWLEKHLQKATNWARNKHQLPFKLREMAYEKSGRLKKEPDALELYKDA
jgi:hypothetical protein